MTDIENLWLVNFRSYIVGGDVTGFFKTEAEAAAVFADACKARTDGGAADHIPFTFIDSFGIAYCLNLVNHVIILSDFNEAAKSAELIRKVEKQAQVEADWGPDMGFGS